VINDTIIGQTDKSTPDYMQSALPYDVVHSSGTNNLIRNSPAGAAGFGGAFSTADPLVQALANQCCAVGRANNAISRGI
jgi:hypothetical protein